MRILSFGHIPKVFGGKQTSGASFVIYQLALNLNNQPNVESYICATDINAEEYDANGVVCFGWNKKKLVADILRHPYVTLKVIRNSIGQSKIYSLRFLPLVLKALHLQFTIYKIHPEVLHFHNYDSLAYIKIVDKGNSKILLTKHSISGYNKDVGNYIQCRKLEKGETLENVDYMVFVTHNLYKIWKEKYGVPNAKCFCIPNAYDESVFRYTPCRHKHIHKICLVTIGSIYALKGQIRVIKAISQSCMKDKIRYVCIGSGKDSDVKELCEVAKVNNIDFEYKGAQAPLEIKHELDKSDYMILPSSYEGFGLVFLESLACGVPVILPQHLPIVEEKGIIDDNNSILLNDESVDSIKMVLDKLNDYHFDKEIIARNIMASSWNNVAKEYVNILNI